MKELNSACLLPCLSPPVIEQSLFIEKMKLNKNHHKNTGNLKSGLNNRLLSTFDKRGVVLTSLTFTYLRESYTLKGINPFFNPCCNFTLAGLFTHTGIPMYVKIQINNTFPNNLPCRLLGFE